MTKRASLVIACLVVLCSAGIGAQGFMRRGRAPLREPTVQSFDGGFNFCRGIFEFGPNGYALGINVILYALSH